jgi:hypothetical protein
MSKKQSFNLVQFVLALAVCVSVFAFVDAHWKKGRLENEQLEQDVKMSRMIGAQFEENLRRAELLSLGIDIDD